MYTFLAYWLEKYIDDDKKEPRITDWPKEGIALEEL